jgi:Family of unknown function (DUF6134)
MTWKFPNTPRGTRAWRGLLCASVTLLIVGGAAVRAAESETREFTVFVDNKVAGSASMTIQRQDDGTTHVTAATNVTVRVLLVKYTYSYSGHEVWKNGRLQQFGSHCNDDGKQYEVSAAAEAEGVRVRVNGQERLAKSEVWLSSYWTLPDAKLRNQVVPLIDADTGRDMQVHIHHLGETQIAVVGQAQKVNHYRLTGTVKVDLWYDAAERLVRQEWIEDGHRTVLELARVHR